MGEWLHMALDQYSPMTAFKQASLVPSSHVPVWAIAWEGGGENSMRGRPPPILIWHQHPVLAPHFTQHRQCWDTQSPCLFSIFQIGLLPYPVVFLWNFFLTSYPAPPSVWPLSPVTGCERFFFIFSCQAIFVELTCTSWPILSQPYTRHPMKRNVSTDRGDPHGASSPPCTPARSTCSIFPVITWKVPLCCQEFRLRGSQFAIRALKS